MTLPSRGGTPSGGSSRGGGAGLHPPIDPAVRLAIAAITVVVAYRTTFVTLFESMQLDTPLAHLSLVPAISIALAWVRRRSVVGPDIRDRQLDWIVGLPLIATALFMNLVLPGELSWEFWVRRVDLLSLPIFVAGVVSLLFGVRSVWKYRLAIGFLFLAWPYPYAVILDRWLGEFTSWTIEALEVVLRPFPLATKVPGSESLFEVMYEGSLIRMSVASACSGANGLVGFLLVGAAFMFVVRGPRSRKIAWLATGALLVWLFNLVRIMSIFWSAGRWGESVAIDGFHPYVGLVVFNLSVVVMMLLLRPFGLHFAGTPAVGSPGPSPDREPARPQPPVAVPPRPVVAALAVAVAAISLGTVNAELRQYDRVASSLGEPQLATFATSLERPEGWVVRETNRYDWSQRFFGPDSEWIRYSYSMDPRVLDTATVAASVPITADVITTSSRGSLSSYGVEQCYSFHGHEIGEVRDVDLGSGLVGGMLTWTNTKKDLSWTTLYWHWPVRQGDSTRYERITLVMQDRPGTAFAAPGISPDDVDDESEARRARQATFMTEFARQLVAERASA